MVRILSLIALLTTTGSFACSCFGPQTFCETLDPPYAAPWDPEWWIPDAVIMGVKLADEAHGMDIKVVDVFAGAGVVSPDEVVRVWGDCGFACRMYPDTWNVGDTVIWGLQYTDLQGNSVCPNELEQEGEFMISVCGIYWLAYDEGIVTGPITSTEEESMDLHQFQGLVGNCLSLGIADMHLANDLWVANDDRGFRLSLSTSDVAYLKVTDATGRSCISRQWDGSNLVVGGLATGIYVVDVRVRSNRLVRKVMVQ